MDPVCARIRELDDGAIAVATPPYLLSLRPPHVACADPESTDEAEGSGKSSMESFHHKKRVLRL